MAVRIFGIGRAKAQAKERIKKADTERNSASSRYNMQIERMNSAADAAANDAALTTEDMYGEQITRTQDQINANANNTKMALARAGAATGGDVTGGRAVTFDKVDTGANEQAGEMRIAYDNKAEASRERAKQRRENILNSLMNASFNEYQLADNNYNNQVMLDLQRKQANRQFTSDLVETAASIAASASKSGAA